MAKTPPKDHPTLFPKEDLLPKSALRRRRHLILPKYLTDEARKTKYQDTAANQAHEIIKKWADLESQNKLQPRKETALDADFLLDVFGNALGYKTHNESPDAFQLERNFTVPGVGTADGALGLFSSSDPPRPFAVIELKNANTNLDAEKFAGRTPVQQCWDYLNALPECPWGIVSNFVTFRIYHRDKTPQAFEYFTLQELRNVDRFREFYCLFHRNGILKSPAQPMPVALRLLRDSGERQREVGDKLYDAYSQNRLALIHHLHTKHKNDLALAIRIAQKILDRIVFVAFCEDRGLLPQKIIERTYRDLPPFAKVTNPRWRNFLDLFSAVDKGHENLGIDDGYNGGLFAHDPEVDDLQLDDNWTDFFREIGGYDFRDEINVDVLGHLFEQSVTELERLRTAGLLDPSDGDHDSPTGTIMPKSAQRKRLGIYYTPPDFTTLIVRKTLGELIEQRLEALARQHQVDREDLPSPKTSPKLAEYAQAALEMLKTIKVCDPACGSGAFLIRAYELLEDYYHQLIDTLIFHGNPDARNQLQQIPEWILAHNLFGVDLSEEAVEITQLALWIRSARQGRTLADLSRNIICGNSLVDDPDVHPKALQWTKAFRSVFSAKNAGFDCVIGNPPWERLKLQEREFFAAAAPQIAAAVNAADRRAAIAELPKPIPISTNDTSTPNKPPKTRSPTSGPPADSPSPLNATSTPTCFSPNSPIPLSLPTGASASSPLPASPPTIPPRNSFNN